MIVHLQQAPNVVIVHDICDHCRRQFAWQLGNKPLCMSCGIENLRDQVMTIGPRGQVNAETATIAAPENAAIPKSQPRVSTGRGSRRVKKASSQKRGASS